MEASITSSCDYFVILNLGQAPTRSPPYSMHARRAKPLFAALVPGKTKQTRNPLPGSVHRPGLLLSLQSSARKGLPVTRHACAFSSLMLGWILNYTRVRIARVTRLFVAGGFDVRPLLVHFDAAVLGRAVLVDCGAVDVTRMRSTVL